MILGFVIISKPGYISFEHYFENFTQYIRSRTDFFEFLDNTLFKVGRYEYAPLALDIVPCNDDIQVGIIYLKKKPLPPEHVEQMLVIASEVFRAEKQTTHRVLKSKYASELIF